MEMYSNKYSFTSTTFRTPKGATMKTPFSFENSSASNKENLNNTLRKEKNSSKVEEKTTSQGRSPSMDKKTNGTSSSYSRTINQEPLTSSSLTNFTSALV